MKIRSPFIKSLTCFIAISSLVATTSQAATGDRRVATERFTEFAKVLKVQPVYREVRLREPRQECWIEEQRQLVGYEKTTRYQTRQTNNGYRTGNDVGSTIVGGLIGGVIGNQLARGHSDGSRTGATVAGAIIGSAIGNESRADVSRHRRYDEPRQQVESRPVYETREVEQCKRVVESRSEQQLQHYSVTYLYKGRTFTTQMSRDPGDRIELQVSVAPARQ